MARDMERHTNWSRWLFGIAFDPSTGSTDRGRLWLCFGPFMLKVWLKRPTPIPFEPGDPLYAFSQSREMPATPCTVVKFRRYSEPFAERPGDIDTRGGA